jgi:hypothetical protein
MPRTPTGLTGASGEYHVAAELSRRGWLATVTIKNSPGTDVLAQKLDPGNPRLIAVQTKTASAGVERFQLKESDERLSARDEWFVLVALRDVLERPRFYVVPRDVVAGRIYSDHREWLSTAGKRPRNPTTMRALLPKHLGGYEEAWDLLDSPSDQAEFRGSDWWVDLARKHPRAEGYPGYPPL